MLNCAIQYIWKTINKNRALFSRQSNTAAITEDLKILFDHLYLEGKLLHDTISPQSSRQLVNL